MLAETVISNRRGQVLLKDTLLKADHFAGFQNKSLVPSFEDAPNFRQVPGLPIFGVAIPTVAGLHIVLDILKEKTSDPDKKVLWHNLREEPLLYINGQPFVVRDADAPFKNLAYTGIDRERVEEMEARLKDDVIQEVHTHNGRALLSGENDDAEVVQYWEDIKPDAIQTPQDVFQQLVHEGYAVDYLRVPLTDEKAPKESDCDLLIQRCWEPGVETSLVFNCQMGRGRTTTAMIIASLLHLRRQGAFPLKGRDQKGDDKGVHGSDWFTPEETRDPSLKNGFYGVVRSLLRVLEFGMEAKNILDVVIDSTSHMQNLREAVFKQRERLFSGEQSERKRNALLHTCLEYLERYCVLIAFSAFVAHPQFCPNSDQCLTFEGFMSQRPEFKSVLQRLLWKNPMSALGLRIGVDAHSVHPIAPSSINEDCASIVSNRRGMVLGQSTILKEDHFPGIEDPFMKQVIEGAPNFHGVPGLPIYGVGTPTIDGIRNVLNTIHASQGISNPTIWINWREEPLVFINGRPFVLREEQRPFKNLKEYTNIDRHHLEKMEERLKQDVLQEASMHGGRILVALERPGKGDVGMLEDKWESIDPCTSVQTPAAVYAMLQEESYPVAYHRLPLTDGTTLDVSDVDHILMCLKEQSGHGSIVFNCQDGIGRTTMGMIVASLVHCYGFKGDDVPLCSLLTPDHLHSKKHSTDPMTESETEEALSLNADEESASWSDGRFLAVRRLTRLLENGPNAKAIVDSHIDACDALLNIRSAIGHYLKSGTNARSEMSQRHAAYNRGVGHLHRYCFLIAVTAYITQESSKTHVSFREWMDMRKDIVLALDSIVRNPGTALTLMLPKPVSTTMMEETSVTVTEEKAFLDLRRFHVLNGHSILKGRVTTGHDIGIGSIPNLKHVRGKHIYTIGDPTVTSLRNFLTQCKHESSMPNAVIIRDIREELVVYINGCPYTRRDLERPVSSLYHAGVSIDDLERMEEILKEDVRCEATQHGGTVLLHHEVSMQMEGMDSSLQMQHHKEDITHNLQKAQSSVIAAWGHVAVDGNVDGGIYTPKDMYEALMAEGQPLTCARVPLSRGRTPQAADLDRLNKRENDPSNAVYLIVARAASSSSARFTAAFFSLLEPSDGIPISQRPSLDGFQSKLAMGEYRNIMHLCRVLPDGLQCKLKVDAAIDACARIGSLREDILSCIYSMDADPQTKQLGLHYLHRYFFLIAYACYRNQGSDGTFAMWVSDRKELRHLLSTMKLE